MKNIYFLFIPLIMISFSCKDKKIDEAYITPENMPAASYMKENPGVYSMWVELLEYTGMFNTINVDANYTCFVPNNEAMQSFLTEKGISSIKELGMEYAKTIIKYHTIPGVKYTQSAFPIGDIADTTATGDKLSIEIQEGGINAFYVNSVAHIINMDIEVTNAIIHVMDKVLIPVTESVWDKVNTSGYTIFSEAVVKTGYDQLLSNKAYKYTLFAVPDKVFADAQIANCNALVNYLQAGADYTATTNLLNKFVAYHILSQQMSFVELNDFPDANRSKNLNTLAENEFINIRDVSGSLLINYNSASSAGIALNKLNIKCKNGIIHDINQMMPVITPELATIQWEFTDYPEIASLFSSVYRAATLSSAFNKDNNIATDEVTCYKWQSVPEDNKNSVVKYFVSETGNSIRHSSLNHDYLYLEKIGMYGWIEMQTPAILKGAYAMKLAYFSPKASSPSGKLLFILDGKILGSEIATIGKSSTADTYVNSALISTITFDITKSHTLRILAGDNSTVYLDYISFEPVN